MLCVQMKMQDLLRTDQLGKAKKEDAATPDDMTEEKQIALQAGPSKPLKDSDEGISSPLIVGTGPSSSSGTKENGERLILWQTRNQ